MSLLIGLHQYLISYAERGQIWSEEVKDPPKTNLLVTMMEVQNKLVTEEKTREQNFQVPILLCDEEKNQFLQKFLPPSNAHLFWYYIYASDTRKQVNRKLSRKDRII